MSLAMSREERQSFLAGVHVAMLAIEESGRGPLLAPIWYGYEPGGEVWIVTDRDSRKGRLLARVRRVSLCVQTETPPYRYVSVEGPITGIIACDLERDVRPLARRYLGREGGDRYVAEIAPELSDGESIRVSMRPERWLTTDYSKQFSAGG
jgi:hypothetical protein